MLDDAHQQVYVNSEVAAEELGLLELAYLQSRNSYAQLSERDAAGLFELLRQHGALRGTRAVKGQTIGPISLAMQLTNEQQRPLIYDAMLFDAVAQFVRMRLAWQEQRLAELDVPTILCLDEPFLEMIGSPFLPIDWEEAQAQIDLVFQDIQGCRAIFAGGAIDWGHLLRLNVDFVGGDVFEHGAHMIGAAEMLAEFVQDGGLVGLGLIPTDAELLAQVSAQSLVDHVNRLVRELAQTGIDTRRLLNQAVVLPNGALGTLSIEEAQQALILLADVSVMLRKYYGIVG